MKIIDLLNKKVNGEELPKKIQYSGTIYLYDDEIKWYADEEGYINLYADYRYINDSIEIIEDKEVKEEKKIPEKIDMFDYFTGYDFSGTDEDLLKHLETNFETINKTINEIIGYLQYIKNKGDE